MTPNTTPVVRGPELLTVAEVARHLRVSKMTVYRQIHDGTLSSIRVGRSFRVPVTALDALLDQGPVTT